MRHVVYDLETDDLLTGLTKVHCLVIRDMESETVLSCTDDSPDYPSIEEGLEVLEQAERVYFHNGYGFDAPALEKLYPDFSPKGKMLDTLPMVRTRFAHQESLDYDLRREGRLPGRFIGRHSLEAWGYRLGILKDDYTEWCERNEIEDPWEKWRPEMQTYCEQDTSVSKQLVIHLRRSGAMPQQVIETDLAVAKYLCQQERNGWPFDFDKAVRLQAKLAGRREELGSALRKHFGTWCEPKKGKKEHYQNLDTPEALAQSIQDPKDKRLFVPKRDNSRYGYVEGVPCVKLKWLEFNPGSTQHIANRLMYHGWKPSEFTPTGLPKVTEDTLGGLDMPFTDDLVEYLMVDRRLGQLAEGKVAWLKEMTDRDYQGGAITGMYHIHHGSSMTTVTHRPRHSSPNLGQVPSLHKPYGVECRELFIVPPKWKLLGVDVDGLELRCLGHYMARFDDGEYAHTVLQGSKEEGTDVHSRAGDIAGTGRTGGKRVNYAYLYGAGDEKLGSITHPTHPSNVQKKKGGELRHALETGFRGLGKLQEKLKAKAKKAGYINLIDGRRSYIRSLHSVLNTLLQGSGAVVCRWWIRFAIEEMEKEFGEQGWEGQWAGLAWVHDETQSAVRGDALERAPDIWTNAITEAGEALGFRLPLTGSADLGDTWADTH